MGGDDWGASGQREWKVWEDTTEDKEEEEERRVKVKMEVVEEEIKKLREKKESLGMKVEEEKVENGSGDEGGLGLVEEWKLKKEREEKLLEKKRKTREKEGMLRRGKEKNWDRKETLEMWELLRNYRELVEEEKYVFGSSEVEARGLVLERSLAKMREFWLEGGNKGKYCYEGEGFGKLEMENKEDLKKDDRVEEMEKGKAVEKGRTYGEVVAGVGGNLKVKDGMEVERKLREERKKEERKGLELEKKLGKVVEVVLDSQEGSTGTEWDKREVEECLELGSGEVEKVVGKGRRVQVVLKEEEKVEELVRGRKEVREKAMKEKVATLNRMENWVGLVVPGVEFEVREKRLELVREVVEQENGIKLMKRPVWLVDEKRRKSLGLKYVGVVIHVARESQRLQILRSGLRVLGDKKVMKKWVEEKQLVFCMKCVVVGHS